MTGLFAMTPRTPPTAACLLPLLLHMPGMLAAQEAIAPRPLTFEQVLGVAPAPDFYGRLEHLVFASDQQTLLAIDGSSLFVIDPTSGERRSISSDEYRAYRRPPTPGPLPPGHARYSHTVSPDFAFQALVQHNNLMVRPFPQGPLRPLTEDGSPTVQNARFDEAYHKEIYGDHGPNAHWWSPDSKSIAFLRFDQSGVPDATRIDHLPAGLDLEKDRGVRTEISPYAMAGEPSARVDLCIASVDGRIRKADLSDYPREILIVRVGWHPDSRHVVFQIQDRQQTWLELCLCDPETGKVQRLLHESSKTWVNVLGMPWWLSDGSFLWLNERTGFRHLTHHDAEGTMIQQITEGEWQVRELLRVDETSGRIWFTGTRDGLLSTHLYRTTFEGGDPVRLTTGDGEHRVSFNQDQSLFIDRYSALDTPTELRVCDGEGRLIHGPIRATCPDRAIHGYRAPELVQIPTKDGFVMDATVLRPPDFDPGTRYAVWMEIYGGPNSPTVQNVWAPNTWFQFLAQQGYIVFQVNNRTASGKGQRYTGECHGSLCKSELADLREALAWLGQHPWADMDRVGITGWSYGGTLTAYAMTRSNLFRLGIAGAGVYDWRLYGSIYTERYMGTPGQNREGYRESSVIEEAANLQGHLILVHATMDDNVQVQNTMQLAYALQMAGKEFELMLYPKSRHWLANQKQVQHLRRLTWNAIQKHLGPPIRPSPGR